MNMDMGIIKIIILVIVAPLIGGLIVGIDRKITARMQGRIGPPILQPFYDFFKLLDKQMIVSSPLQLFYVLSGLVFTIFSLILFLLQKDLLLIVFVMALSSISLIMGAMSIKSPYSRIGGQREMIQLISYEPVLILFAVAIYQLTGGFGIRQILALEHPLLYSLPLVFIAFLYILTIKLRKSPFDFSGSHHAHQELIKGVFTEFSGPQLALIELTHWYEVVLIGGFIMLFFATNLYAALGIAAFSFFVEILIDNINARINWKWMIESSWLVGVILCTANILWLYIN